MNAKEVLTNVEKYLSEIDTYRDKFCQLEDVYKELGVFDWFKNYLTKTDLKDMRKFLREAIKLEYTGYVCFKVGVSGCANGMWACKKESTTGYAPDGECLYKSFTPAYNYWSIRTESGSWSEEVRTIKELEELCKTKEKWELEQRLDVAQALKEIVHL